MIVKPSDNVAEGVTFSTVFLASEAGSFRWPNTDGREFSIRYPIPAPPFITTGTGTIVSAAQGGNKRECRVNWLMKNVPGVNNPIVDTPEISEITAIVGTILERSNPGISFSPLETMAVGDYTAPKGIADLGKDAVEKAGESVAGLGKNIKDSLSGLTTSVFIILGVVAVGLAVGLSRSSISGRISR